MSSIHLPSASWWSFCCAPAASTAVLPALTAHWKVHASTASCKKRPERTIRPRCFSLPSGRQRGSAFLLEGRADGIFTDGSGTTVIDEIKTTAVPYEAITEDMNPCHWAQGMVYGAIYCSRQSLPELNVQLTYYQIDTDQIIRFVRHFSAPELEQFLHKLLCQYAPWARRQLDWAARRSQSLAALPFPFAQYRPGQRALAGEVYRACRAGRDADHKGGSRLFCQAPTGIGKTMSVLFPALRAMGEGSGEKLFYLTARNTTQPRPRMPLPGCALPRRSLRCAA